MNISDLIVWLQLLKRGHGDLVVVAHDGMDPSDLNPVKELRVLTPVTGAPSPHDMVVEIST